MVYIGKEYTQDLLARVCSTSLCPYQFTINNDTINGSTIHLHSDVTSECTPLCVCRCVRVCVRCESGVVMI